MWIILIKLNDWLLTFPLCVQLMVFGGSGVCRTIHVRLIVDPAYMNRSGPPKISVSGSEDKVITSILFRNRFINYIIYLVKSQGYFLNYKSLEEPVRSFSS